MPAKKRTTTRRAPAKETVAPPPAPEPEIEAVAEEEPLAAPQEFSATQGDPPPAARPKCANCDRTSVVTTDFTWAENVSYCNICLPRHLRYLLA